MKVKILDYAKKPTEVDIGELDNVVSIGMTVITGDEILSVLYKDGTTARFDSSDDRNRDYFDDEYTVFNREAGVNLLEDQKWLKRKSSYDY